jgi:serine/threonine protein kinase
MHLVENTRYGPYLLEKKLKSTDAIQVFRARRIDPPQCAPSSSSPSGQTATDLQRRLYILADPQKAALDPQRFIAEAQRYSVSPHPALVTFVEWGHVETTAYAATPEIRGWSLEELLSLAENKGVRPDAAVYIIAGVADALAALHTAHPNDRDETLLHRNLSPNEIMIQADGRIRVQGAELSPSLSSPMRARRSLVRAKLGYMAPEQVEGADPDTRSDLFSCGVILYELLTGRRLFLRATRSQTILAVRKLEPPPPSTACPWIPEALDDLVFAVLDKQQNKRIQSAQSWARDLEHYRMRFHPEFDPALLRRHPRDLLAHGASALPSAAAAAPSPRPVSVLPSPTPAHRAKAGQRPPREPTATMAAEAHPDLQSTATHTANRAATVSPAAAPPATPSPARVERSALGATGRAAAETRPSPTDPSAGDPSAARRTKWPHRLWRSLLFDFVLLAGLGTALYLAFVHSNRFESGKTSRNGVSPASRDHGGHPRYARATRPAPPAFVRPRGYLSPRHAHPALAISGLVWRLETHSCRNTEIAGRFLLQADLKVTNSSATARPIRAERFFLHSPQLDRPVAPVHVIGSNRPLAPRTSRVMHLVYFLNQKCAALRWLLAPSDLHSDKKR